MVLSFVIFIGFLIFAGLVLKLPTQTESSKINELEIIKDNIIKLTSVETTTFFIDKIKNAECGMLDANSLGFEKMNFSVNDPEGEAIQSKNQEGIILFTVRNELFYKITFSQEGLDNLELTEGEDCEEVQIQSTIKKNQILEKKINDLIEKYHSNYNELKSDLNVAPDEDFNIKFDYRNGTILGNTNENQKTDVFIKKFQVIYLNNYAQKRTGDFIVSIW